MTKAIWEGEVIAEIDAEIQRVDGYAYFPAEALKKEFLRESSHTTVCGWKGTANYYDIVVGEKVNANAAWYYADPKPKAKTIQGHVAFWRGVTVED